MTTLGELKEMLEDLVDCYGEDMPVVFQSGSYAYSFKRYAIEDKGVRAFWGNDYKAIVLEEDDQVGAVWDEDELDLREEDKDDD